MVHGSPNTRGILVLGAEQESLQLPHSALLGKHLDATNSTSGMSIYGRLIKTNSTHNHTQIYHPHFHM